ncbi:MAG: hypothetical protein VYC34_09965, partial [Planctomycetota bacterium]|nr:hypothetical protein [Planctomycetota bacterium]
HRRAAPGTTSEALHMPPAVSLLGVALGLFAIAAIFGMILFWNLVKGIRVGVGAGVVHGVFALSGLVVLGFAIFAAPGRGEENPLGAAAITAFAMLCAVLLVGVSMEFGFRARGKKPPRLIAGLHAATAAVAIAILTLSFVVHGLLERPVALKPGPTQPDDLPAAQDSEASGRAPASGDVETGPDDE